MQAGDWYCCLDDELQAIRDRALAATFEHNSLAPDRRGAVGPALAGLLGAVGAGARIEAPFQCAYAHNIHLGEGAYLNFGCVILDHAPVRIGRASMLGPHVQIYTVEHHREAGPRRAGMEICRPVTIGDDVWIGGGAIILSGVSISDGAIVGAGAVVTRDVAAGTVVAGNPARPITGGARNSCAFGSICRIKVS